jgi:hypothetical protein
MINDGQKRHVVNDFDCLAAEIAGNLISTEDEENAMRELWRYLEALHRTLLKSGIPESRAWDICSELKGRVVEELNRMRQLAH